MRRIGIDAAPLMRRPVPHRYRAAAGRSTGATPLLAPGRPRDVVGSPRDTVGPSRGDREARPVSTACDRMPEALTPDNQAARQPRVGAGSCLSSVLHVGSAVGVESGRDLVVPHLSGAALPMCFVPSSTSNPIPNGTHDEHRSFAWSPSAKMRSWALPPVPRSFGVGLSKVLARSRTGRNVRVALASKDGGSLLLVQT